MTLQYGDSTSGTKASGPVLLDNVAVAGLSLEGQPFAAVNETNNSAVQYGGAGIFGLGFPSQRYAEFLRDVFLLLTAMKFHSSGSGGK